MVGRKRIEMMGQVIGRLKVTGYVGLVGKQSTWECTCSCGGVVHVAGSNLRAGRTKSCGCLHLESCSTHGMYKSGTYRSWIKMKDRCRNPNFHQYHDYGGRGVTVCDRWADSFENFLEDMGERPIGKTLNRVQGSLVYSKATCNWATISEQNYDKRSLRNKSGKIGVCWYAKTSKWSAEIGVDGVKIKLGLFSNKDDAISARIQAELKYYGFRKE